MDVDADVDDVNCWMGDALLLLLLLLLLVCEMAIDGEDAALDGPTIEGIITARKGEGEEKSKREEEYQRIRERGVCVC